MPMFENQIAELLWRIDTLKQNIEFLERNKFNTKPEMVKLLSVQAQLIELVAA